MPVPAAKSTTTKPSNGKKKKERDVVYPKYEVRLCCNPTPDADGVEQEYDGPITVAMAKELLGWETDDEYVLRMLKEDPNRKEKKLRETDFLLKDRHGNKIRCFNNTLNRPFDLNWSKKIAQDILTEDYEMNGEDIIIGRTGLVLSGQHRLVGLVIAYEMWLANQKCYKDHWVDVEPYIESVVFFGAREDQKVLKTYDNVKPRSLSDTIYTSPIFANLGSADKKRCSVMMDQAVDFLWRRLDATSNKFVEHQTHSASLDFLERHQKHLVSAVKHIYDVDKGDTETGFPLSVTLGLNAGRTAAMLFLMGSSGTDEEKAENYHSINSPKKESQLDWTRWDRALSFWSDVCQGREQGTKVVEGKTVPNFVLPDWVEEYRKALADLCNENWVGTINDNEKAAVTSLAWATYVEGDEFFTSDSIVPEITIDKERNKRVMTDPPVFGYHDKGPVVVKKDPEVSPAEVAARAAAEKERGLTAMLDAAKTGAVKADTGQKVVPVPSPRGAGPLNSSDPVPDGKKNGKGGKKGKKNGNAGTEFVPSAEDLNEEAIESGADEYDQLAAELAQATDETGEPGEDAAPVTPTPKKTRSRKKK